MADPAEEGQKVLYLCISAGLVLMAGLMSGLTLGLMSLDQVDLEVGNQVEGLDFCRLFVLNVYSSAGSGSQRHSKGEEIRSTHFAGIPPA